MLPRCSIRIRRLDTTFPSRCTATAESAGFDLSASRRRDHCSGPDRARADGSCHRGAARILSRYFRPKQHAAQARIWWWPTASGVIDPDYSRSGRRSADPGAERHGGRRCTVKRGDRLAQGIMLPAPRVDWRDETTDLRRRPEVDSAPPDTEALTAPPVTAQADPAPRHGRVLRVGRAAGPARAARAARSPSADGRRGAASSPPPATRPRQFGVRSAIPMARAVRLCPDAGHRQAATSRSTRRVRHGLRPLPVGHAAGRAALARRGLPGRDRERVGRSRSA